MARPLFLQGINEVPVSPDCSFKQQLCHLQCEMRVPGPARTVNWPKPFSHGLQIIILCENRVSGHATTIPIVLYLSRPVTNFCYIYHTHIVLRPLNDTGYVINS